MPAELAVPGWMGRQIETEFNRPKCRAFDSASRRDLAQDDRLIMIRTLEQDAKASSADTANSANTARYL